MGNLVRYCQSAVFVSARPAAGSDGADDVTNPWFLSREDMLAQLGKLRGKLREADPQRW